MRRLGSQFDAAVKREGKLALASCFKKASHQASNATSKPKASCSAVQLATLWHARKRASVVVQRSEESCPFFGFKKEEIIRIAVLTSKLFLQFFRSLGGGSGESDSVPPIESY